LVPSATPTLVVYVCICDYCADTVKHSCRRNLHGYSFSK
jgi:hypothetical protein